jgi:hypothetical protein
MNRKLLSVLVLILAALPIACATAKNGSGLSSSPEHLSDLQLGKKYYTENCQACHRLHNPSEFSPSDWSRIMVKMQKKAQIDDATKDLIMDYLTTTTTKTDSSNN